VIRRLTDMDAELQEPVKAPEEPTVIFDPAKLTAQLTELLELYLARAKEALAEEQMSSKEAVACAKQVSSMLEDTQSGKLAQVDTSTHWPRLEFTAPAFVGRGPVPRRLASCSEHPGGPQVAALQNPPIQSLADAVSAVCQYDPETAILEPWAQLLARMNKLTQRVAADVEAWKADCRARTCGAPPVTHEEESRFSNRDSLNSRSRLESSPAGLEGRDSELSENGGARVPALQHTSSSVQQRTTNNQQPPSGYT